MPKRYMGFLPKVLNILPPFLDLRLTSDSSRPGAWGPRCLKRTISWCIGLGSSWGRSCPFLIPPSAGFPSTLVPAKPMEQAAAPKVPCTRTIVSRTRPPSTLSSRLRRQRGSSDTTSQSRYLRKEKGRRARGNSRGHPAGRALRGQPEAAYLCLNRTMATSTPGFPTRKPDVCVPAGCQWEVSLRNLATTQRGRQTRRAEL